jgi:hypothetical protein
MVDRWCNYVVRKYIRARNAAEAIELEKKHPVCEVNEMQDTPAMQNEQTDAVGFHVVANDYVD